MIDYEEERLYWVDRGKGSVESISLNGRDRVSLFSVEESQLYGIALHQVRFVFPNISRISIIVFDFILFLQRRKSTFADDLLNHMKRIAYAYLKFKENYLFFCHL